MLKIALPVAILLASAAAPTQAQSPRQVLVSYGDLDITSSAGQATLDRRLSKAIRTVCGYNPRAEARDFFKAKRCMKIARADIEPQRKIALARALAKRPAVAMVFER